MRQVCCIRGSAPFARTRFLWNVHCICTRAGYKKWCAADATWSSPSAALAAARAIGDADDRAKALVGLAPHLAQLPCQRLYPLWQETLPILAARTREDLLADLCALAPVIAALGGEEAVAETSRAIQDVGLWWP